MSYLKLSDTPGLRVVLPGCADRLHRPPHVALAQGTWQWRCPMCGGTTTFSVYNAERVEEKLMPLSPQATGVFGE